MGFILALFFSDEKRLLKADILFLCHDNHRYVDVDGRKYAPLIDTIIDDLGETISTVTMAMPFSRYFGPSCHGNTVMYNKKFIWVYLKKIFNFLMLSKVDNSEELEISAWRQILKKINPKVIIGSNPSPMLCLAAKEMGIWTADIQHGIIAPGNYYDINKRLNINQHGWPDAILCWDEYSDGFVRSNLGKYVKSVVIGHPAVFSIASKKLISGLGHPQNNRLIPVLVTMTSLCPESQRHDPIFKAIRIPQSLVTFIKEHGSEFEWNMKIHPARIINSKKKMNKHLESIFKGYPNVLWDQCNNETVHASLNRCSAHVTFNSASVRDASVLGIRSSVLDTDKSTFDLYFSDLSKNGFAVMESLENYSNFSNWLKECHKEKQNNFELHATKYREKFQTFINSLKDRVVCHENDGNCDSKSGCN